MPTFLRNQKDRKSKKAQGAKVNKEKKTLKRKIYEVSLNILMVYWGTSIALLETAGDIWDTSWNFTLEKIRREKT